MSGHVTMADVARAAGVHQTTVSLALRNHPRIPEKTRARIQRHAEKLGYSPNPLVSALIAQRRLGQASAVGSTLAYLHTHHGVDRWRISPNYVKVFEEMGRHAATRGYRIERFWLTEPGMTPERMRQILLNRGIRGIIISPMPLDEWTIDFDFSGFACVALGLSLRQPEMDRVSIDYRTVLDLCVMHLRERNCRKIAFAISQGIDDRVNHLYLGQFLAERHRDPRRFLAPITQGYYSGEVAVAWLLKQRPDALITAVEHDWHVFSKWIDAAVTKGLQRPLLVCLESRADNKEQAGIIQNFAAEARAAVDLVTNRVERAQFGLPKERQTIHVEGHWKKPFA